MRFLVGVFALFFAQTSLADEQFRKDYPAVYLFGTSSSQFMFGDFPGTREAGSFLETACDKMAQQKIWKNIEVAEDGPIADMLAGAGADNRYRLDFYVQLLNVKPVILKSDIETNMEFIQVDYTLGIYMSKWIEVKENVPAWAVPQYESKTIYQNPNFSGVMSCLIPKTQILRHGLASVKIESGKYVPDYYSDGMLRTGILIEEKSYDSIISKFEEQAAQVVKAYETEEPSLFQQFISNF